MKRKMIPVICLVCLVLFLAGCYRRTGNGQITPALCADERPNEGNRSMEPSEPKAPSAKKPEQEEPEVFFADAEAEEDKMTSSQKEAADQVPEIFEESSQPAEEHIENTISPVSQEEHKCPDAGSDVVFGAIQRYSPSSDQPPKDTVRFTESRKEEIMETQYVKSVVDENDPNTYEIVKKEPEVSRMYVNQVGDVKYAYENGIWYEYKYSSGNVVFDFRNDELALALLKPNRKYDRLEVLEMDCQEVTDENGETQFRYNVRYQGINVMEKAPEELGHLKAVDLGLFTADYQLEIEEKVPVLVEVRVGTGKYRYYGWQQLDGKTYYFDEYGEKVTGSQVIQGIRHEFDEQGVKISKAGVEVSEENGTIDWEAAAKSGIDMALIQCAYRDASTGVLTLDTRAAENLRGAKQAGLKTGIYLFSQAVTEEEALEEAEFLIYTAEKYEVRGPVVLKTIYANPEQNGRADGISREKRTEYVNMCCNKIQEAGYTPMIHTEETFLMNGLEAYKLSEYQLWLTAYDLDLAYTGPCAVWQYTDKGTVNGINGYAGLNITLEK